MDEVTEDVREFLHDAIESYEQLELLLLLKREPAQHWSLQSLSARLRISSSLIEAALPALLATKLLQSDTTCPEVHYSYAQASDALDATVTRLERLYAEQPILIVKLMSANAIERVRTAALHTFADAFILRSRGKDNG
jgi:hypothetical protein